MRTLLLFLLGLTALAAPTVSARPTPPVNPEAKRTAATLNEHWSFQPIVHRDPPAVQRASWVHDPIDAFVLKKLETAGLAPAPEADRYTLIRRASFDLTGLPPSADEVDSFLSDDGPAPWERVVDRLLASPRYGERWGRHWLDVARYADTKGYVFTSERRFPYSFTYRDYVVGALNSDLPYNRFIFEQIAADQMDAPREPRALAAMGFLTLGRRFLNNTHDIIDDRIDVVTRGTLALTVTCARCHDHKYDPIPTADYYSLYGVFASSQEPGEPPLIGPPANADAHRAYLREKKKRESELEDYRTTRHRELLEHAQTRVADYLLAVEQSAGRLPKAHHIDLSPKNVNPVLLAAWTSHLRGVFGREHPVFGVWHALCALEAETFPTASKRLLAERSERRPGSGRGDNALLLAALRSRPLNSIADAAGRVGELIAATMEKDTSNDASAKELHQVIRGGGVPANISRGRAYAHYPTPVQQKIRSLRRAIDKLEATSPGAPERAMALVDRKQPHEPHIFLRGQSDRRGAQVPRRFLAVLSPGERKPFPSDRSGRRELAEAITHPGNPLTARVITNRVWLHHFGAGLVRTPSDFGTRSDPPSHPGVLDNLAADLLSSGWSLKKLHRRILLSATYRQSGRATDRAREIDPANRLLSRMPPRRLEFEALRDAMLKISGRLDFAVGGRPVELWKKGSAAASTRRTLYGFIDRQNLPGILRAFDFASPDTSCPQRHETSVPQQTLFLLNAPFVIEQAKALAAQPAVAAARTPEDTVRALYAVAFARPPSAIEVQIGLSLLNVPSGNGSDLSSREIFAQTLLISNASAFID